MTVAEEDWYAPLVRRESLDDKAVRAVLFATLNVILAGAVAWRAAAPSDGYHAAAARAGKGPVPIWGAPWSLSPTSAAMLNGALGHHFAFDDTADVLLGHPTVVIAPPLLALATECPLTVDAYLSAYASGYECMVRLARQLNPGHYRRGFHATATLGTLGAANAVATALGAEAAGRVAAVGLAASRAGGLRAGVGHPVRAWHAGFAAAQGLEAALLACDGVRSSPSAVTGRHGYLEVFGAHRSCHGDNPPPAGPVLADHADDVGRVPALVGPAVLNLKEYPGCGALAPAVSALKEAMRRVNADSADVAAVDVTVNPFVLEVVTSRWPDCPAQAGFSLTYALAVVLRRGQLTPRDLTVDALGDRAVRELAGRISVTTGHVGPTKYESEVTLRARDGGTATVRRPGVGGRPASTYRIDEVLTRWSRRPPPALAGAARLFTGAGPVDMAARTSLLLDAVTDGALT